MKIEEMSKRVFFVIGPEGAGTYMLAKAFAAAGCTYCDQDNVTEFLNEQKPDLLVLRRSLPHAGAWPDIHEIIRILSGNGYDYKCIFLMRDEISSKKSVLKRKRKTTYTFFEYEGAMKIMGGLIDTYDGRVISYEYFVLSQPYRKHIFSELNLSEPIMEFYDANAKYYV